MERADHVFPKEFSWVIDPERPIIEDYTTIYSSDCIDRLKLQEWNDFDEDDYLEMYYQCMKKVDYINEPLQDPMATSTFVYRPSYFFGGIPFNFMRLYDLKLFEERIKTEYTKKFHRELRLIDFHEYTVLLYGEGFWV